MLSTFNLFSIFNVDILIGDTFHDKVPFCLYHTLIAEYASSLFANFLGYHDYYPLTGLTSKVM